jgi:hypothetical protein
VFGGERIVRPPPTILLHLASRRDEPLAHRGKVRIGVIQAED